MSLTHTVKMKGFDMNTVNTRTLERYADNLDKLETELASLYDYSRQIKDWPKATKIITEMTQIKYLMEKIHSRSNRY